MLVLISKGILLGFAIAAPVGPIGVLCIRRTLAMGRKAGFLSGLGAASADMFYGFLAAFGLTAVTDFLVSIQGILGLIGGFYLVYLGVRTIKSPIDLQIDQNNEAAQRVGELYLSTFFLTLTNPVTILSFLAIFAGMGLAQTSVGNYADAGLLVLGVFLGSAGWWLLLSAGVGLLRERMKSRWLIWVNRLAGIVLVGFGLIAIFTVLGKLPETLLQIG